MKPNCRVVWGKIKSVLSSHIIEIVLEMFYILLGCIWAAGLSLGNGAVRGRLSKLVSPSEQGGLISNQFVNSIHK